MKVVYPIQISLSRNEDLMIWLVFIKAAELCGFKPYHMALHRIYNKKVMREGIRSSVKITYNILINDIPEDKMLRTLSYIVNWSLGRTKKETRLGVSIIEKEMIMKIREGFIP